MSKYLVALVAFVFALTPFVLPGPANAQAVRDPSAAEEAAFESAQLAVAPGAASALADGAARVAASDPALLALFDASRRADEERRALETVLATLRAQGEPARVRAGGVAIDLERAVAEAGGKRARLVAAYPRFVALVDPDPLSISDVRALLKPREALVLILPTERGTYVWAVTTETSRWSRADVSATEVSGLADAVMRSLVVSSGRGAVDAARRSGRAGRGFARDAAFRLYQALWSPIAADLAGTNTVYVVADGPLRSIPPGVLVTAPPQGRDDDPIALRATPWLQRRHSFALLPAVANLRVLENNTQGRRRGFAGFGDANTEAYPDGSVSKSLPSLPQTRSELRQLSRTLGGSRGSVRLGDDATEQALKSAELDGVSVLALATHALVPLNNLGMPMGEAALVFTPPAAVSGDDDGLLTTTEAARLRLNAYLVILSACDTGLDDPDAIGIDSLSRAFFHAGARALLVSNWRIRDDVAARLSTRAIQIAVHDRVSLAEALRRSALQMMDDQADPGLAHPSNWAAFSLLGNGRGTL